MRVDHFNLNFEKTLLPIAICQYVFQGPNSQWRRDISIDSRRIFFYASIDNWLIVYHCYNSNYEHSIQLRLQIQVKSASIRQWSESGLDESAWNSNQRKMFCGGKSIGCIGFWNRLSTHQLNISHLDLFWRHYFHDDQPTWIHIDDRECIEPIFNDADHLQSLNFFKFS